MVTYKERANHLRLLMYKYVKGQLTTSEKTELDAFINRSPENAKIVELLTTPDNGASLLQYYEERKKRAEAFNFQDVLDRYKRYKRRRMIRITLVISIALLLISGAAYFLVW